MGYRTCADLVLDLFFCGFFFFKQKTAYEMRISDWSSDVCSSDLSRLPRCAAPVPRPQVSLGAAATGYGRQRQVGNRQDRRILRWRTLRAPGERKRDRKSVV